MGGTIRKRIGGVNRERSRGAGTVAGTMVTPEGNGLRPATSEDLNGVVELVVAYDVFDFGEPDFSAEFLRDEWARPRFDLQTDTWVVTGPGAEIVGYASAYDEDPHLVVDSWAVVHPEHPGRGIGELLLGLVETRAREHVPLAPAGVVRLQHAVTSTDEGHRALLVAAGFRLVRHYRHMEIDPRDRLEPPPPPDGIAVRAFLPGRDERALYSAIEESFRGEWCFVLEPFDEWVAQVTDEGFDPGLWLLAEEGDEMAGLLVGKKWGERGWIDLVGVRPPWRRRGIGACLLGYGFAGFARRGFARVMLNVDAANETGATDLYERAGMRVRRRWDLYEKELSGRAYSL